MKKNSVWLLGMFMIWACVAGAPASWAQGQPFSVSNIQVDVQSENAYKAREEAIAQAQVKAFDQMAKRLLPDNEYQYLPNFETNTILGLVRDFAVRNEQTSATRYRASFSVRFHEDKVKELFDRTGISFSSVARKPVLVIPVLQVGKNYVIWEDPNPWRQAWREAGIPSGLVPVEVPFGDISDIRDIPGVEVFSGHSEGLDNIAMRYDADQVFFAVAQSRGATMDPTEGLNVSIYYFDERAGAMRRAGAIATSGDESAGAAWAGSVVQVVEEIRKQWKQQTLDIAGQDNALSVYVPIEELRDWVRIQQRLNEADPISSYNVQSLNKDHVDISIEYSGSLSRLKLALEQKDLTLSEQVDEQGMPGRYWLTFQRRQY